MRRPVTVLVLSGLITACEPSMEPPHADDRWFGALLPFTGALAAGTTNYERAMILAEEAVNAGGGIASGELRLRVQDTHSDVTRGLGAATLAIDDASMMALVGPADPPLITAMVPLVESGEIVQMLPRITVPPIVPSSVNRWFKIMPSADVTGCAIGQRLYNDGRRRVVILHEDDAFSAKFADGVVQSFAQMPVVGQRAIPFPFDPGAPDSYGQVLQSVYDMTPDAVLLVASAKEGATMVNDWGGPTARPLAWYFGPSLNTSEFVFNTLPGELEGTTGIAPAVFDKTSAAFTAAYSKRWAGDYPLPSAYAYYDSVAILALATESAAHAAGRPPTRQELREHIASVSQPPGDVVAWNELGKGLALLRDGKEINYQGASGAVDLASSGAIDARISLFRFWEIHGDQIVSTEYGSCVWNLK